MGKHTDYSDFIGKVFGDLIIIRRAESKVREPKWFCLCVCGRNTIVASSKLKKGQNCCTTCSKLRRDKPSNYTDLVGKKFGKITVIKRKGINKYGHALWLCKCDCGNQISMTTSSLKGAKSCRKCVPGGKYTQIMFNDKEKWCDRCKKWEPLDNFSDSKQSRSGKVAYCKECYSQYKKGWWRKGFYGVAQEEYEAVVKEQDGKCALCNREERLLFDHCHVTGKFRGLVCSSCNVVLGRFKDDIKLMEKAIIYLNKHTVEH